MIRNHRGTTMRPIAILLLISSFTTIALFANETPNLPIPGADFSNGSMITSVTGQEPEKLVYADFETAKDNRPVSSRGGLVMLFSYQERPTLPSRFKGKDGTSPPAPEFARPSIDSPNTAIAFDFELPGTNQYAGVGVQVHGQPEKDGKPVPDDVSSYKYLTLQLYAMGTTS